MKEIAITENKALTAQDVRSQVNLIQNILKDVMKQDEHFGVIPGCGNKPTLLKPGAEKIAMTFKLAPEYDEIAGTTESDDFINYKINCKLIHIPTGMVVGSGRGTCNSKEKKYRTRSVYENKATDEEKATGKLVKGKYSRYLIPQDPWDIQNTLYKMACKRALIGAILTATAASDLFTQDIEDLPAGTVTEFTPNAEAGKPSVEPPKKVNKKATEAETRNKMISAFKNEMERIGADLFMKIIGEQGFETVDQMSIDEGRKVIAILKVEKVQNVGE